MLDVERLLVKLVQGEALCEDALKESCQLVKMLLLEENTVAPVAAPVVIAGDLHGQFYDLLELFRRVGDGDLTKLQKSYVFLGDFVDRGFNSVENI